MIVIIDLDMATHLPSAMACSRPISTSGGGPPLRGASWRDWTILA